MNREMSKILNDPILLMAAFDNMVADEGGNPITMSCFVNEIDRLTTDGEHPYDCKCIIHR